MLEKKKIYALIKQARKCACSFNVESRKQKKETTNKMVLRTSTFFFFFYKIYFTSFEIIALDTTRFFCDFLLPIISALFLMNGITIGKKLRLKRAVVWFMDVC